MDKMKPTKEEMLEIRLQEQRKKISQTAKEAIAIGKKILKDLEKKK